MKKLFLILFLLPLFTTAQQVPNSLVTLSTLTDLRALPPGQTTQTVILMGLTSSTDGNGGTYYWSNASTANDDGFLTVKETDITTGRWVRVGNGNVLKGTSTFSGVTLTTTYTVNYGVTYPFTPVTVITVPKSANAAALSYITNITTSSFQIVFLTVPVLGTNNISFDWIVVKS